MTEFRSLPGFDEALRPPIDVRRARLTPAVLRSAVGSSSAQAVDRMARIARRAPEVMVKITGRTRDGAHLRAHLDYISRHGALPLAGPDAERIEGRAAVTGLAAEWSEELAIEPGRRKDSPASVSIVLSMPKGTDPGRLQDAAAAFAGEVFGERFPYVFVLHDEGRHPHVHLTVRSLGLGGERLNPRKADLQLWRERFAHALRAREIEAEATPRRARGVIRKAERLPVRKLRERFMTGAGPAPRVVAAAARDALQPGRTVEPWRVAILARQRLILRGVLGDASRLARSEAEADRGLASAVARSVQDRQPIETQADTIRRVADRGRDGKDRDRAASPEVDPERPIPGVRSRRR